jgi:hypothetical protein
MTVQQQKSSLAHFYDLLDGFEDGDPIAHLAEDLEVDMMFPGFEDIPAERFDGGKEDFKQFMKVLQGRGSRFQRSETLRRHNIETLTVVDGLELMVGRGLGGRRNGTLLAAAQEESGGKLRRYLFVMSSAVTFSDLHDRVKDPPPGLIERFFDRLDGISFEDPLDLLSDDFQFEMVFPGLQGPPDERTSGSKEDFTRFMTAHLARRPRQHVSQEERRHHIRTSVVIDGLEIVVAMALNGRRNGTLIAAAEPDRVGRMRRFIAAMGPAVNFPDL